MDNRMENKFFVMVDPRLCWTASPAMEGRMRASGALFEQFLDHFRSRYGGIGQAVVASLVREGQPCMIETEGMKQRCVQIANADDIADGAITEIVGMAMDIAAF